MSNFSDVIAFSVGRLYAGGVEVAVLQSIDVEFSGSTKELRGGKEYALAVGVAGKKVSGKFTTGTFAGRLISAILGGTSASGARSLVDVALTTAGSNTLAPATGTFVAVKDVKNAQGVAMEKVASAPTVGQYSTTGTNVTLNAAEPTPTACIATCEVSTTSGTTISVGNNVLGLAPTFTMHLDSEKFGMKAYAVVFPSINFASKNEDFTTGDVSFELQAPPTGAVYDLYLK